MTILVFCPNLVGDTVMATPAIRALRLGYPDARIVALIRPRIAATLDGAPWFDEVILHDHRSTRVEEQTRSVLARLRQERAEIAVLFPNSFRSALMAWRAGARRRVGYARGGRGVLLTDRLTPRRDGLGRFLPTPILDDYLAIARRVGCEGDGPAIELFTTLEDEQAADRAWERLGLSPSRPVVTFNTGGAFGPAKSWPEEHFAHLARRFSDETAMDVLVVCGPGERDAARSIVRQADRSNVVSLADEPLGLGLTKACVKRSSLLITTDSGPRHFAAGFDVPVLGLFGPTHIVWTLTHFSRAVHLHHPLPCGPCQKSICPVGHHRCLRELSPDAVYRVALEMLKDVPKGKRERVEAI